MQRTCFCGILLLAAICSLFGTDRARGQLAERVLPASTKGVLIVTDGARLSEQWRKTQLSQLLNDPIMKPFEEDLRRQFDEKWSGARERLGLTIEDLRGVPSGEVSFSLVQMQNGEASVVLLMDVTGHIREAEAFLDKVAANLTAEGARQSSLDVDGVRVTAFALPRETAEDPQRYAFYCIAGNVVVASDQMETLRILLYGVLNPQGSIPLLSASPAYQAVMRRCAQDAPGYAPQIRWFVEPLGYAEAIRNSVPQAEDPAQKDTIQVIREQGFDAIRGVGGFVDFSVDGFEMITRVFVYAPGPYRSAMQMLVFPNRAEFAPPAWVPRNCAKFASFYCDPHAAFDNVGSIIDEVMDYEGAWEDVLYGLETDRYGPQVSLRNELIDHLSGRVSYVVDYTLPITTESERMVIALETTNEQAVARAVDKLLKDDQEVERYAFGDYIIWKTVPRAAVTTTDQPFGDVTPLVPRGELPDEEEPIEPFFPNAAVCVAHGQLFYASEMDFLLEILRSRVGERDTLGATVDYQVVQMALKNLGAAESFLRVFTRTDESYRPTYELIRQGKMPESDMVLGRVLNLLLPPEEGEETRVSQIDGSKLPEFDAIRRHFGPGGTFGTSETDGWFFKGCLLGK